MNTLRPLQGLAIRAAAVRLPNAGNILACDHQKESEDIPHAVVARWRDGSMELGKRDYNAHSICVVSKPEVGFVDVSEQGYYASDLESGTRTGDIFTESSPPPKEEPIASFRSISAIDGVAYAVGLGGLVYRFDAVGKWTRINEGLPEKFNIQAIDGYGGSDLYAAGMRGRLWQFDGERWTERELPTNLSLTSVKCASDGLVYAAGHRGILLRGRNDTWEVIEQDQTKEDIWDIEWFEGQLYASNMKAVYTLQGDNLQPVDFGADPPRTCYQLSAAPGVLWSSGAYDVMAFDGASWSRVV